jgi:hypothetical protein
MALHWIDLKKELLPDGIEFILKKELLPEIWITSKTF